MLGDAIDSKVFPERQLPYMRNRELRPRASLESGRACQQVLAVRVLFQTDAEMSG
jgi:hypothetical protein